MSTLHSCARTVTTFIAGAALAFGADDRSGLAMMCGIAATLLCGVSLIGEGDEKPGPENAP